jgi:hypothetical protein
MGFGGEVSSTKAKRPFNGKTKKGSIVARGCGIVMPNRRKQTKVRT